MRQPFKFEQLNHDNQGWPTIGAKARHQIDKYEVHTVAKICTIFSVGNKNMVKVLALLVAILGTQNATANPTVENWKRSAKQQLQSFLQHDPRSLYAAEQIVDAYGNVFMAKDSTELNRAMEGVHAGTFCLMSQNPDVKQIFEIQSLISKTITASPDAYRMFAANLKNMANMAQDFTAMINPENYQANLIRNCK